MEYERKIAISIIESICYKMNYLAYCIVSEDDEYMIVELYNSPFSGVVQSQLS